MKKFGKSKKFNLAAILMAAMLLLTACQNPVVEASSAKTSLKEVTRGTLLIGLTADGKIALPVTPLDFEVSGKISNIYVSAGSFVKKGDVLAELDDSDLQIALENAKINLSKAETAYQDAIVSAEYNLKTETKNLEELKKKYSTDFDDYTYTKSITEAETTLKRREKDLEDAKKNLDEAMATSLKDFDSYTYDTSIANAKLTLQRRESELKDAQDALTEANESYNSFLKGTYYDYNVENLKKSLERKKQELQEAEKILDEAKSNSANSGYYDYTMQSALNNLEQKKKDLEEARNVLADALSDNPELFDSYSYDSSIQTAQTNIERKTKEYNDAKKAYEKAVNGFIDQSVYQTYDDFAAYIESYKNKQASAKTSMEDAQVSYDKAVSDKTRALEKYIEESKTKVESTEKAVSDAEQSLSKNFEDAETKVKNARTSYDDAQSSLDKAKSDLKESLSKSIDDAKSKLKSAQTSRDDAKISYDRAVTDLERAKTSYLSDKVDQGIEDAQTKYYNAQNSYADAASSLKNARESLTRARESYEKDLDNVLSSIDLSELKIENMNNSTSSVDNAFYNVEDAKNNLKTAENNLAKNKIISPIDGTVLSVSKKIGEVVSGSDNASNSIMGVIGASNSVMSLCDTSEIYFTTDITESDINSVEVGQTIRVNIEALDKEVYGTVYSVSSVPSVDSSGIITYEVIGKLNEVDSDIKDNMSVYLTFIKKERTDVLMIPNKAIYTEDGQQYVNVAQNGDEKNIEKRAVTCGLSNGTQTEVMDGLEEGEIVVIGGASRS